MVMLAMWYLQTDAASLGSLRPLLILVVFFTGMIAFAMILQAIMQIAFSVKAGKAIKDLVDSVEEFKERALPLMESVKTLTATTQAIVSETVPKVRTITDNLVEMSDLAVDSARHFDRTIVDVNLRTQRQIARVDGMVAAALTTTAELVETINEGIRVPAQKIAAMAGQAKDAFDAAIGKAKSMANGLMPGRKRDW